MRAPAFVLFLLLSFGCLSRGAPDAPAGGYHDIQGNEANGSGGPDVDAGAIPDVQANASGVAAQPNRSGTEGPGNALGENESGPILEKVIPSGGVAIAARWGDLGPRIVESGALNTAKLEALMERNGRPLTDEQRAILENGSNNSIRIDRDNAYFVLNLFWGLGLANDNNVLRNFSAGIGGPAVGNLASTGFWSLGERSGRELFASRKIIELTESQQAIVNEVAGKTYRPCCDNPTAFPDCNHGMAALGLAEWMADQNASEGEIYDALLVANSYWFPQAYVESAAYLEYQNTSWEDAGARELLSANRSSYSGYQDTKRGLDAFPPVDYGGAGCFA
ncbi:MAG: hypothetical protein AB1324_00675 [Candidatus Micrarchaeota archaeon]